MASYIPVKLAYKTVEPATGAGDKTPIIFLHACTLSSDSWGDIPQKLANETKRKVYLLDARNHGDSEWSDVFNFDINSSDLVHFMNTMNIPKAVLLGHSMGGITAIKTALKNKERVEMIIVEDMTARKVPKPIMDVVIKYISVEQQAIEQMPTDVDENGAKKFILEFLYKHLPSEMKDLVKRRGHVDPQLISLKRNPNGRYDFKSNIKVILNAVKDEETLMSEPTGVYDGPAFFIYGKLSPFMVGTDEPYIKNFFPKAEFEAIEEAAHGVHIDCPQEFSDAVLKFLSRAWC